MQVRNIDLSLQTIATDNVTILDAVEIGEFRGNPTLANPNEAFTKIKSNCQRNGRESNGVDKLYITGRNAGFAYLAATVGFAPTSVIYTGTGIEDLRIKICNILTSTNEEDVQVIDISAPMSQGVVTEGLFENVTMDMSSGRANICSTPDTTMVEVLTNLKNHRQVCSYHRCRTYLVDDECVLLLGKQRYYHCLQGCQQLFRIELIPVLSLSLDPRLTIYGYNF
jgi:hypothetical protein